MTDTNRGGTSADQPDEGVNEIHELDAAWATLENGLRVYLATMVDPDEGDHLLLELPEPYPDGDGCPPYVQVAGCGEGRLLRIEVSGNTFLRPLFQLDAEGCRFLRSAGWGGNVLRGSVDDHNWHIVGPVDDVDGVVNDVVVALRHHFGIAHPELLTYQAWGPAAEGAEILGLCATDDVPVDAPGGSTASGSILEGESVLGYTVLEPADRDELLQTVERLLREKYEGEPTIDEDGDFVLHHLGQPVWVRARTDQPAIEIMARVAHDVRSRRATAVEIGLLNRDSLWVGWDLRGRTVWQTLVLPAFPFVPRHLNEMLDVYLEAMSSTRDDLAYRTGAKVA